MQNNEAAEQFAVVAAEKWLALIDNDDTGESWEQAASHFKAVVSAEQWKTSLEAAQVPLGKVTARKLKSKRYAEELPGAPRTENMSLSNTKLLSREKGTARKPLRQ